MVKVFTVDNIDEGTIATVGVLGIDHNFFRDQRALFTSLLYFDQVHLLDLYSTDDPDARRDMEIILGMPHDEFEGIFNRLIQLEDFGLIKRGKWPPYEFLQEIWHDRKSASFMRISDEMSEKAFDILHEFRYISPSENMDKVGNFFRYYSMSVDASVRIGTSLSNKQSKHSFVSILNNELNPYEIMNVPDSPQTSILKIAINKLPVIDGAPDLSKIRNFKDDPDTKLKLSRLRNWVIEISKKEYSVKEIEQKMDYLLAEYTNQFKVHEIKHRTSVAESIIMPILEVAENLAKLQFSKIGKMLFDIQKTNMALLEDEVKFPGSEIAFIHKARATDFT